MQSSPTPPLRASAWLRELAVVALLVLASGCTNFYGKGIQYRIEHRIPVGDTGALFPLLAQKGLQRRVESDGTIHLRI